MSADLSPQPVAAEGAGAAPSAAPETTGAIFLIFLRLGLTAFGGPVAHLGYFRDEFVARRRWLSDAAYAELTALCQVAPGPASSQTGFALGLMRGGWRGAAAAFLGFTAPSAVAMALLGALAVGLEGGGWLIGLKAMAAAVVALALHGMAGSLAPDAPRKGIALAAAALAALAPGIAGQLAAVALGAAIGWRLKRGAPAAGGAHLPVSPRAGGVALGLLGALLLGLPLLAALGPLWQLSDGIARAGAFVFGGGHVVLPLLQAEIVETGMVGRETFLAGYGAAQAMPGPLFTIASYLGAAAGGAVGALLASLAIFAPGFLVLIAAAPFWARIRAAGGARDALAGINAAVVGLLLAAFFDPVLREGVTAPAGFAIALAAAGAMALGKVSPAIVAPAAALLGAAAEAAGLLG